MTYGSTFKSCMSSRKNMTQYMNCLLLECVPKLPRATVTHATQIHEHDNLIREENWNGYLFLLGNSTSFFESLLRSFYFTGIF